MGYKRINEFEKAKGEADFMADWALDWAAHDGKYEDQDKAKTAARFSNEILDYKVPYQIEVYAAVMAHAENFDEAVSLQKQAISLLNSDSEQLRAEMLARLEKYARRQSLASR